jgi:hypothetical protein
MLMGFLAKLFRNRNDPDKCYVCRKQVVIPLLGSNRVDGSDEFEGAWRCGACQCYYHLACGEGLSLGPIGNAPRCGRCNYPLVKAIRAVRRLNPR